MDLQGAKQERGSDQSSIAGTADHAKIDLPASKSFSVPAVGSCGPNIAARKLILLDLPNECLQSTAEFLESERDINAFARANQRLYNLLNTYLYRHNVQSGSSALLWAASHGQDAAAKMFLAEGANVQVVDGQFRTPLILSAMNGHEGVMKLLLAVERVNPESKDSNRRTPLMLAAMGGHEGVVKLLLAVKGVNLESKDSDSRTPLILAVKNCHEAVVKLLLGTEGVNPECQDSEGQTPLRLAYRTVGEAEHLMQNTDNIEAKDKFGGTPLTSAIENGSEKICQILLAKGAEVNYHYTLPYSRENYTFPHNGHNYDSFDSETRDNSGVHIHWSISFDLWGCSEVDHYYYRTPLSRASERECVGIVKLLLEHPDIDVNVEDGDGRTPLWWAVEKKHDAVVRLLLKKGAALKTPRYGESS